MKFVKYNDNKSVTIPPAVLTVCGLDDEGKLEMAGARGAVILSKSEMTAMEMVRTILALTDRAGQLMRELRGLHRGALHLPRRGHRGADPPRRHRS